jgi:hypothetical protein
MRIQTHKGAWPPGLWGPAQEKSFADLKEFISEKVILKLPDLASAIDGSAPFHVVVDASQEGMGGVLLQGGRPVAFYSKQFSSTERKFGAGDREMCAIIFALKTWRCYLEGAHFTLFTDHQPLVYFEKISQLDRRKAGYVEFISRFNFKWIHIKGNTNVVADCLSRDQRWTAANAPPTSDLTDGLHIIAFVARHRTTDRHCAYVVASVRTFVKRVCLNLRSGLPTGRDDYRVNKRNPIAYDPAPYVDLFPEVRTKITTPTFVPDPHPGREFPSALQDMYTLEERIHEDYNPPPTRRDLEQGEMDLDDPSLTVKDPAAEPDTSTVEAEEGDPEPPPPNDADQGFPDRFFNPIVARILMGYTTDPVFKNKAFTKNLKRTKTGLYLQPYSEIENPANHPPKSPPGTTPTPDHLSLPRTGLRLLPPLDIPEEATADPDVRIAATPSAVARCAIMVPNVPDLKRDIIAACHEPPYSGHRGIDITTELVRRDFEWPGVTADVERYVRSCLKCQLNKCRHTKQLGLLKPLSIPTRRFGSLSMDMIVRLPTTRRGFDAVLVVVCRLSKYTWFIPCHTSATSADCARLVVDNVCKYVGLPDEIVSDRDKRFGGGKFSGELWRLYGVEHSPTTAYHPQSDGQTERMNKTLHEYIRNYIGPTHKDWDAKLTMAQFALNNSYSASIGSSPFYFVLGFHPKTPFTHQLMDDDGPVPDATAFALARNEQLLEAQRHLKRAQARMKLYYDRSKSPAQFCVGDMVLLSTRNLNMSGCAKYIPRYVGPFMVTELVGTDSKHGTLAYKLALPDDWQIHDVFHISSLKPFRVDLTTSTLPPVPPLLDDYSYRIEHIVGHRLIPGTSRSYMYRCHLWDTTDENDGWEDENTLLACVPSMLDAYKALHAL